MKLLQILTIIFCLGTFLVPKDSLYTLSPKENCCKADSTMDECCKDHQSSSSKHHQEKTKSCNDDCCSSCIACYTFIETPFSKSLNLELSYYKANKSLQFQYSDPYISDRLKEIWQPPKIA